MILKSKNQIIKHQYTVVELLVVLVIAGLLTGLTIGGIKGALARQGATGAVRSLGTKISLAQSFAVSRNRYAALLMPDYDGLNINPTIENYSIATNYTTFDDQSYSFTKNRLCFVNKTYDGSGNPVYSFDRWIEGYEWQTLPAKTVAFITQQIDESTASQVLDVPDPTDASSGAESCTALIFKPSGALVSANQVVVRVFRAAYVPATTTTNFIWQGKEDENKGWKIVVNGFTGRARFCLGSEDIED
jgi:type II secretory pathway pseudopilin PulG